MRYLLILFNLFIFTELSLAQNCDFSIFGTVKDEVDGKVLPGASVKLIKENQIAVSEIDGHFHFYKLCQGNYNLEVSFVGYSSKIISIDVKGKTDLTISLAPSSSLLSTVKIIGSRVNETPLQSTARLKDRELALTRGESLGESLKKIPGLNSIQTGPSVSKPVIHGMHSNRVLIFNSGVRLEGQQWGSEHAPEVDPFLAHEIKVIKGAASVQYGADAVGGVILIEPASLDYYNRFKGEVDFAAMSNNQMGALSTKIEGSNQTNTFAWRLQSTLKQAGNAKTADYILDNTAFRELNGSLTLGYQKGHFSTELFASSFNTKLGIFTASNIGSTTDLEEAIQQTRPDVIGERSYRIDRPYQDVQHQTVKLKSSYLFDELGKLGLQYSFQRNIREEYSLVRASNRNNYQLQFELNTQNLDLYFEHKPIGNFNGKFGLTGMFQQNFYDGSYLIPFFDSYNTGAYFIEKWSKNQWEVEAGFRFDYKYMQARLRENPRNSNSPIITPEFNFTQTVGTLGASYLLKQGLKVHATVAQAWRPPAISELFIDGIVQAQAAYVIGDRNLKEESSLNLSTGISKTAGKLTGDISFYYDFNQDYIYLRPTQELILTTRGAYRVLRYVQIDARFYGADAFLAYQLHKNLNVSLKYSGVRAYNKANNSFLELIPADRTSATLSYKIPDLKFMKSNLLDFNVQHVAQQTRVNPNAEPLLPPAAYTLFGADFTSQIRFGKRVLGLGLSAQNLFNKSYRDYLNNFRYFNDDLGRNIIVRLNMKF
ncbi:TonB-dependent receptor [Pedobacter puniceum]|uniref:TonB-dependent receptor n=1 Tax=Pedobacter puniceum TaxID=2666136 RepID=A0A7K0FRY7_9SPHI|nr:TonB-dependent receptor [Pedobacter puniceum]MRX48522.1 TonB-dependent receptor [Pedobacter puniceum]